MKKNNSEIDLVTLDVPLSIHLEIAMLFSANIYRTTLQTKLIFGATLQTTQRKHYLLSPVLTETHSYCSMNLDSRWIVQCTVEFSFEVAEISETHS